MNRKSLKKVTPCFLVLLILFQSCKVYNKTSVSLEEAARTELRAKVINKEQEKLKFKKIITENEEYFGLKKKNGNWVKFPLNGQNIEQLLLEDKKKSTWATIGLGLGIPVIFYLVAIIYCSTEGCISYTN